MSQYIPSIGLRGLFTLLAPFDTALLPNISYSCEAVRRMSDIVAAGGDPFADYYAPNGLTEAQYKADVEAGVCIISLQAAELNLVYVPSSYIQGFPDIGGVPYTSLLLAIRLGPIPDKLNLDYLKSRIESIVLETIGIVSETKTVVASHPLLLSQTNADTIEAARLALITTVKTDYAKLIESEAKLLSAQQKIAALEQYIHDHPVTP